MRRRLSSERPAHALACTPDAASSPQAGRCSFATWRTVLQLVDVSDRQMTKQLLW